MTSPKAGRASPKAGGGTPGYSAVREGSVMRQSTGVLKRWQKKWMMLDHGTLAFGKTEENPGTLERQKVDDCWNHSETDDGTGEHAGLAFDVMLDGKRTAIRADSVADRKEWVGCIKDCNVEVERNTTVRHVSNLLANKKKSGKIYSIASDVIEADDIFDIGLCLGSGSAATVYAARHKTSGRDVAIKKISKRTYLTTERSVTIAIGETVIVLTLPLHHY